MTVQTVLLVLHKRVVKMITPSVICYHHALPASDLVELVELGRATGFSNSKNECRY